MENKKIVLQKSECIKDIRSEQSAFTRGDLVIYVGAAIGTLISCAIVMAIGIAADVPTVLTAFLGLCALSVCAYYGYFHMIPTVRTMRLLKTDEIILTIDKVCGKDQKAGRRHDMNLLLFVSHKPHTVSAELFRECRFGDEFYIFTFKNDGKRPLKIYPASKYEIK